MIRINTIKHLAALLNIRSKDLDEIILDIDKYYTEFEEVKEDKNGNPRIGLNGQPKKRIFNPSIGRLKRIQSRILNNIISKIELPKYAFGAVRKRDNIANAKQHQGKKYIFTTDLKDFFPSINHSRVFEMFRSNGLSPTVARKLTQLVTYKGKLPQGAPTSSLISNLVFKKVGNQLDSFAKENQITFTSFIDDLTFSSPIDFKEKVPTIIDIIETNGFAISPNKTNYKTKNPKVTGIPVKNNWLAVPKNIKSRMKQTEDKTPEQIQGLKQYADRILKSNS